MITIDENEGTIVFEDGTIEDTADCVFVSDRTFVVHFCDLPKKVVTLRFKPIDVDTTPYKEQVESLTKRANHFEEAYKALYAKVKEFADGNTVKTMLGPGVGVIGTDDGGTGPQYVGLKKTTEERVNELMSELREVIG